LLEENGRGERVFFPSHSNGHQAWDLPLTTFSPEKNNFNSILRVFVATSFLRRGGRISFGVGERKDNRMRIL
jgi:hypothetical protein